MAGRRRASRRGPGHQGVDRRRPRPVLVSGGRRADGRPRVDAQVHLLYGRAIARWWDIVAGVRQDARPGPSRTWAAVGVQGLAPYWFEVEATAYVGEGGRTRARVEVEYELLLTNRLVLQPLLELEIYGKADPETGLGAGLSRTETGVRLRYEIRRELAPYVGISWDRRVLRHGRHRARGGRESRRCSPGCRCSVLEIVFGGIKQEVAMKSVMCAAAVVMVSVPVFAHVGVTPRESKPGATETYTLRVPSEGGRTTTSLTLDVPDGVTVASVAAPAGATHEERRVDGRILAITWTVTIQPGAAAELSFVARNPAQGTAIMWHAHQRYPDGTVSDWTGAAGSPAPAPVTRLVLDAPPAAR